MARLRACPVQSVVDGLLPCHGGKHLRHKKLELRKELFDLESLFPPTNLVGAEHWRYSSNDTASRRNATLTTLESANPTCLFCSSVVALYVANLS